jgi:putative phosphoribosyl transferase
VPHTKNVMAITKKRFYPRALNVISARLECIRAKAAGTATACTGCSVQSTKSGGAALDLILVRKIGVPYQPELAMGAVVDGDKRLVVRNEDVIRFAGIADSEFNAVCDSELAEIERRRQRYLGSRERVEVAGRTAIVIDDGIATGATTRAALRATRMRKPKKLILAVPVAPADSFAAMRQEADDVVCLEAHTAFRAIGLYYSNFWPVPDEEVIELLARFPVRKQKQSSQPAARRRGGAFQPSVYRYETHATMVSRTPKCPMEVSSAPVVWFQPGLFVASNLT